VDILRFISKHFTPLSEFLCDLPDDTAFSPSLPQEIFELHLIHLPFSCVTKAVERHLCSLPGIMSLCRALLTPLRDAPRMRCSKAARAIFRDMHIRLRARFIMNNPSESLAAHALTLSGRDQIRKSEKGSSTRGLEIPSQGVFPVCPDAAILEGYCHEKIPYDGIIIVVFQFAVNSESMIGETEYPPSAFTGDLGISES
jgi:hypothetical protein